MRVLTLSLIAVASLGFASFSAKADGYGFDGNGNYYNWYDTGRGDGYGFDGNDNYHQWYSD
jgi:hypothetical protein